LSMSAARLPGNLCTGMNFTKEVRVPSFQIFKEEIFH